MAKLFGHEDPDMGRIPIEARGEPTANGAEDLKWAVQNCTEDLEAIDKFTELSVKKDFKEMPKWEWEITKDSMLPKENTPERQKTEDLIAAAKQLTDIGIVNETTTHATRTLIALKQTEYEEVLEDKKLLLRELENKDSGLELKQEETQQIVQDNEQMIEECTQALERIQNANLYLSTLFVKNSLNTRVS